MLKWQGNNIRIIIIYMIQFKIHSNDLTPIDTITTSISIQKLAFQIALIHAYRIDDGKTSISEIRKELESFLTSYAKLHMENALPKQKLVGIVQASIYAQSENTNNLGKKYSQCDGPEIILNLEDTKQDNTLPKPAEAPAQNEQAQPHSQRRQRRVGA